MGPGQNPVGQGRATRVPLITTVEPRGSQGCPSNPTPRQVPLTGTDLQVRTECLICIHTAYLTVWITRSHNYYGLVTKTSEIPSKRLLAFTFTLTFTNTNRSTQHHT